MTTAYDPANPQNGLFAMRTLKTTLLSLIVGAVLLAAPVAHADHGQPFGAGFGAADAFDADGNLVPLFHGVNESDPGDADPKAVWNGVCDTETASTAGSGVGVADLPALHCIDPGQGYFRLNDQENPDPPIETTWQPDTDPIAPGIQSGVPQWRLDMVDQAGAHPDLTFSLWLQRSSHSPGLEGSTGVQVISDGEPKDVIVKLPPGLMGNPNAIPQCPAEAVRTSPPKCPPATQVGVAEIALARAGSALPGGGSTEGGHQRVPIWNVEPRRGKLAEFLLSAHINDVFRVNVPIVARARTDGDFGIDALAVDLPSGLPVVAQTITMWGVPFDESHDKYRAPEGFIADPRDGIPAEGFTDTPDENGNTAQHYDFSWGPVRPFFSNPTECDPANPAVTRVELASWRFPDDVRKLSTEWDEPFTGCENVPFDASMALTPSSTAADGPSGLTADLTIPQLGDAPFPAPDETATAGEVAEYVEDASTYWKNGDSGSGPTNDHLAPSQLEKAVVTLPEGVSLNPSSAAGLAGCSDEQLGLTASGPPAVFNNEDPFDGTGAECPVASRIGKVEVYSPVIPRSEGEDVGDPNLVGDVVLGTPQSTDPQSGKMLRLFLVVRNEQRGFVAKIAGSAVANPATGQLSTTFEQNPRVPFETLSLQLKGGARGTLALQTRCESRPWSSLLSPWTAAHGGGGLPVNDSGAFTPTSNCAYGFAPRVNAGMDTRQGGASGSFTLSMERDDGDQWLAGLTAKFPKGLLAAPGLVDLCTNAQAAAAACPASSRVGTVDAAAGAGTPFVLEKKGSAYLTEGYKGGEFGMAAIVPVEAGPFSGPFALSTMVVRQALHVDRNDATVTVVSDPLPTIWHGIPLRTRRITVKIDRTGFMRNPTDCSPKEIAATVQSVEGTLSTSRVPFQATGCGSLPFRPKLALRLTGRKQVVSGKHPGVQAVVTQKAGEAGIKRVKVALPKKLALDPSNAQALCEFVDGTKPDLENHCPKGSIIGRAKADTPLLDEPLTGNVYFVKNVRIDPVTGAPRRTLPMLIVALRGDISVNLRGESSVVGGRLVNTFANVPDAPIDRFAMKLAGGGNGILVITESARGKLNICGRLTADADVDGQNGRRYDREILVRTPCKTLKKKVVCKTKKQRRTKACKRRAARRR